MTLERALTDTNALPIRHQEEVHAGKVRSVYWFTPEDSQRLIAEQEYPVPETTPLGAMVISDRISAFDVNWRAENGLTGVPGKGAALNAISEHWFTEMAERGLAGNHILDSPHPLVWIVQKAEPVMLEGIARQYLMGSMWRKYQQGQREFAGVELPDGLEKGSRLPELLLTPTTKGIMRGIPGVKEKDDASITYGIIENNAAAFGLRRHTDVELTKRLTQDAFGVIEDGYDAIGETFYDSKFEFGYLIDADGEPFMGYIDEVGTPDSSRTSMGSKEIFRQELMDHFGESIMTGDEFEKERKRLAAETELPEDIFLRISEVYADIAERLTGSAIDTPQRPREEIMDVMNDYGLAQ